MPAPVRCLRPTRLLLLAALLTAAVAPVSAQTLSFTPVGLDSGPVDQIDVHGRYAYLAADYVFTIVDLSDLSAPEADGHLHVPREDLGLQGRRVDGVRRRRLLRSRHPRCRGPHQAGPARILKTPGQARASRSSARRRCSTDHMSGVDFVDVSRCVEAAVARIVLPRRLRARCGVGRNCRVRGGLADRAVRLRSVEAVRPLEAGALRAGERPANGERCTVHRRRPMRRRNARRARGHGGRARAAGVRRVGSAVGQKAGELRSAGWNAARHARRRPGVRRRRLREGFRSVDSSKPQTPRIVGRYRPPLPARDVAVADSLVFVVTGKVATRYQGDGEVVIPAAESVASLGCLVWPEQSLRLVPEREVPCLADRSGSACDRVCPEVGSW